MGEEEEEGEKQRVKERERGKKGRGGQKEQRTVFRSGEIRCWFAFELIHLYAIFLRTSQFRLHPRH